MSSTHESDQRTLKAGDRLWIWSADPPSEIEQQIAAQLSKFAPECTMFHVMIFSWRSTPLPETKDVVSHFPEVVELAQDRCIGIHRIEKETNFKIPVPTVMFSNRAAAGEVQYSSKNVTFSDQILAVVGCRQVEHDSGHASLKGAMDIVGWLSLQFGKAICEVPVLSAYFCTRRCKFISSTLAVTAGAPSNEPGYGLKTFYELNRFDGEDDVIHAALWFSGKAFTEIDVASKIIFLHTALDIVSQQNIQNYFRRLYKNEPHANNAIEVLREFSDLRGKLIHKGILGNFPGSLERYLQLLTLDAIVARQGGTLSASAFAVAFKENN